jgi:hypothetical protein
MREHRIAVVINLNRICICFHNVFSFVSQYDRQFAISLSIFLWQKI